MSHAIYLSCLGLFFFATPKSKRVAFPSPCAHFVCCWGVHSSPSSLLAGTLLLFWSVYTRWFACFLPLFALCCCVRWIFRRPRPTVAQKIVWGFLRSEKRIFLFFSLFSASFSCFFFSFRWCTRESKNTKFTCWTPQCLLPHAGTSLCTQQLAIPPTTYCVICGIPLMNFRILTVVQFSNDPSQFSGRAAGSEIASVGLSPYGRDYVIT